MGYKLVFDKYEVADLKFDNNIFKDFNMFSKL